MYLSKRWLKTLSFNKYNEEGKIQPWVMRIAHNSLLILQKGKSGYPTFDGKWVQLVEILSFAEENVAG